MLRGHAPLSFKSAFRMVTGWTSLASANVRYDMPRQNDASISRPLGVRSPGPFSTPCFASVRIRAKTRVTTSAGTSSSPAATPRTVFREALHPRHLLGVARRPSGYRLLSVPGVPNHLELPGPLQYEPQTAPHDRAICRHMPIDGVVDTPLMPSVYWTKF